MPRKKAEERSCPSFIFEEQAALSGASRIAGLDEAGRGPLAGPVVAAAVILPSDDFIPGINDSKLLTPGIRENLYPIIIEKARAYGVGIVSHDKIDEINIFQATRLAMCHALANIDPQPDYLLIDGTIVLDVNIPQKKIIKGDRLSFSIAAAGIIAKVVRDGIMMELHEKYPMYGFDQHKGYATAKHKEALCEYGPSPVHRLCFKGVRSPELPLLESAGRNPFTDSR